KGSNNGSRINVASYSQIEEADRYCKIGNIIDNETTSKTCVAITTTKRVNEETISANYNCQLRIKCKYKKSFESEDDYERRCKDILSSY
ncbi:hypothetical protein N9N67_08945, partial [Bacteriovoracaceae bacterium]|nr:hypothetical protein [Bacteriovoracaceae bacterium]